jgi:hypothetical protein
MRNVLKKASLKNVTENEGLPGVANKNTLCLTEHVENVKITPT